MSFGVLNSNFVCSLSVIAGHDFLDFQRTGILSICYCDLAVFNCCSNTGITSHLNFLDTIDNLCCTISLVFRKVFKCMARLCGGKLRCLAGYIISVCCKLNSNLYIFRPITCSIGVHPHLFDCNISRFLGIGNCDLAIFKSANNTVISCNINFINAVDNLCCAVCLILRKTRKLIGCLIGIKFNCLAGYRGSIGCQLQGDLNSRRPGLTTVSICPHLFNCKFCCFEIICEFSHDSFITFCPGNYRYIHRVFNGFDSLVFRICLLNPIIPRRKILDFITGYRRSVCRNRKRYCYILTVHLIRFCAVCISIKCECICSGKYCLCFI